MRAAYADLSYGKFDSPMARFLYERLMMEGDFGEDEYSDEDGFWVSRYGRRVLEGDDRGFIYYTKFPTAEAAEAEVRKLNDTILDGDPPWVIVGEVTQ